jgi:hypothetical protein
MMVGAAFILLNNRCGLRETAQQAEIRLADFPTILPITCTKSRNLIRVLVLVAMNLIFCGIYLIHGNLWLCYPAHSLRLEIGALSTAEGPDQDKRKYGRRILYVKIREPSDFFVPKRVLNERIGAEYFDRGKHPKNRCVFLALKNDRQ